jgi:sortase A
MVTALSGLAYLSAGFFEGADDEPPEQQQPAGQETSEDAATQDEEPGVMPPDDPTLYLTVPRLGLQDHTVRNDSSEEALGLGAIKIPSTGFPWEEGANTYIACHRLGFPGTESFNQCLDLPSMEKGDDIFLADANGMIYAYRVSEAFAVASDEMWVTEPVEGKDVVSLQTCIETLGDVATLGPDWEARFVVRAERVG